MFNALFLNKFTEFFTYELWAIVSSDTNRQSMDEKYRPYTCNDLVSSCRPQDFHIALATVVVNNYKEMVS